MRGKRKLWPRPRLQSLHPSSYDPVTLGRPLRTPKPQRPYWKQGLTPLAAVINTEITHIEAGPVYLAGKGLYRPALTLILGNPHLSSLLRVPGCRQGRPPPQGQVSGATRQLTAPLTNRVSGVSVLSLAQLQAPPCPQHLCPGQEAMSCRNRTWRRKSSVV